MKVKETAGVLFDRATRKVKKTFSSSKEVASKATEIASKATEIAKNSVETVKEQAVSIGEKAVQLKDNLSNKIEESVEKAKELSSTEDILSRIKDINNEMNKLSEEKDDLCRRLMLLCSHDNCFTVPMVDSLIPGKSKVQYKYCTICRMAEEASDENSYIFMKSKGKPMERSDIDSLYLKKFTYQDSKMLENKKW